MNFMNKTQRSHHDFALKASYINFSGLWNRACESNTEVSATPTWYKPTLLLVQEEQLDGPRCSILCSFA